VKKKAAIPVILAALIAAAAVLGYSMRIDTIVYTGNTQYDESWLTRTIFGGLPNRLTYYLFHRSHVSIPEVEKYDVRFSGNEADVQIYEKTRVGYIRYMGANLYFDRYGTIVESTDQTYENIPEITGLSFDSLIVGQKIDTQQELALESVLTFTQSFSEYSLPVSRADFTDTGSIVLTMNNVTVQLGTTDHLSDKLFQLNALYSKLADMSGTLYLSSYDGTQDRIIFRDDTRSAQTDTQDTDASTPAAEESTQAAEETTPAAEETTQAAEETAQTAEETTQAAEETAPAADETTQATDSTLETDAAAE
jgi:cell division protein FtsQ